MWTTAPPLRLLRYLIVLRVNSSAVRLSPFPAADFSATLGRIIASRLSTQEAREWRKALNPWENYAGDEEDASDRAGGRVAPSPDDLPDLAWPIDALLHIYPGKQIYGFGERILWEIKLLGDSADHNLFLERLLPAIESAGLDAHSHPRQSRGNSLWGRFEIERVSVARGTVWQPLAQQGRIDLGLRPDPLQWADGLPFRPVESLYVRKLIWQTPFAPENSPDQQTGTSLSSPSLAALLEACARQIEAYLPGWLDSGQRPPWEEVMEAARRTPVVNSSLTAPPANWPGQLTGEQTFSRIPASVVPYLVLGSLLHIGHYRHFGCGTFLLQPAR